MTDAVWAMMMKPSFLLAVSLLCLLGAASVSADGGDDAEADLLWETPTLTNRQCNCNPQTYQKYCDSIEGQWYFRVHLTAGSELVNETGWEYGAAVGVACITNCSVALEAYSIRLSASSAITTNYHMEVTSFQNSGRLLRMQDPHGGRVVCQVFAPYVSLGCVSGGILGNDDGTTETNVASYLWEFERGFTTSQCHFAGSTCEPRVPSPSPSPMVPSPSPFFAPVPTPVFVPVTPTPSPSPVPSPSPEGNPLPVILGGSGGLTDGEIAAIAITSFFVVMALAAIAIWGIFFFSSGPMVFTGAGPSMVRENFEG